MPMYVGSKVMTMMERCRVIIYVVGILVMMIREIYVGEQSNAM